MTRVLTCLCCLIIVFGLAMAGHAAKLPPPSKEAQEKSFSLVEEVFKEDFDQLKTSEQAFALSDKLFKEGLRSQDDPAGKYVLLRASRDMAMRSGNVDAAMRAVDEMYKVFELDALEMKTSVLTKVAQNTRTFRDATFKRQFASSLSALIHQAVENDRFDVATTLSAIALSSARKSKDIRLAKQSVKRSRTIEKLALQFETVKLALATLRTEPTDSAANLDVGKYRCFVKRNWESGLPFLALGGKDSCATMARKDISENPKDKNAGLAMGDGWWSLSEKFGGDEQLAVRVRAAHWYRLALPSLPQGINRLVVERRLKEIGRAHSSGGNGRISLKSALVIFTFDKNSFVVRNGQTFTTDWSGNGFHGKMNGPSVTDGVAGNAIRFDGRNDALHPINLTGALRNSLKEFSICGWVRPLNVGQDSQHVFNVGSWGNNGLAIVLSADGTTLTMDSFKKQSLSSQIAPNQWNHFSATWGGDAQYLYINGELKSERKVLGMIFNKSSIGKQAARFGELAKKHSRRSRRYFNGDLDEVVLFGRRISSNEVEALYEWGKAGRPLVEK